MHHFLWQPLPKSWRLTEISVSSVHQSSCERHHNAFIYPFVKVCNMAYTSCITRIISGMTSLFKFYNQFSSNK